MCEKAQVGRTYSTFVEQKYLPKQSENIKDKKKYKNNQQKTEKTSNESELKVSHRIR